MRESSTERSVGFPAGVFRSIAAGLFAVAFVPAVPAWAGPAIPESARPDFVDPLAPAPEFASETPAQRAAAAGPDAAPAGAGSVPFTIIEANDPALSATTTVTFRDAVSDRFLGGGRAPDDVGAEVASRDTAGPEPGGISPRALFRQLVNTGPPGTAGGGGSGGGGAGAGTGGNDGATGDANSAFGSNIDETVTELIVDILDPEITGDGLITFSIAGFGEFALILAGETGGIFLVDLQRGTAFKVVEADSISLGEIARRSSQSGGGGGGVADLGSSGAWQRILNFLRDNVLPVVTSPITFLAAAVFGSIWLIIRVSAARE